jgi:hypothetical protein
VEVASEPPTRLLPVATRTQLPSETVPAARALIRPLGHDSPPSYTPPLTQPHTFDEVKKHKVYRVTLPPFSATSSLVFSIIPPGPHVALSALGTGQFQLSDVALRDLNMKLYVSRVC